MWGRRFSFVGGDMEPIEFDELIEKIQLVPIKLSPGDTLFVLTPPTMFSEAETDLLILHLSKVFPNNQIFVAPAGIEFQIISEHGNED